MKAAVRYQYGSPEKILVKDVDTPKPPDDEVLIKVNATTVNRTDCANLTGKPFVMHFVLGFLRPKKAVLGTDFAGEIVEVGKNIQHYKIGDRVFGFRDTGSESQAQYISIRPEQVALQHIPEKIDYQTAVASLEGAHYAYSFYQKSNLKPGMKGLINGASGAIGSALLQLVKLQDIEVSVTCDTKNTELIASLGADKVIDYTQHDFTRIPAEYDFIFDAVGKSNFQKCRPLLKKGGIYISSEAGPYGQNVGFALFSSVMDKKVIFPIPISHTKSLPFIKNLLEQGEFKPLIDRKYSLKQISEAYKYVMTGQKTGNVLIEID